VDFLKEDNCHAPGGASNITEAANRFGMMRDALNKTGRPIFFSVCGGGDETPLIDNITWYARPPLGAALANSWRISGDVGSRFLQSLGWDTAISAMVFDSELTEFGGPGGWNDPDMLLTSDTKNSKSLSAVESRTQFNVWSVLAAPLLIGGAVARLSAWDLETYSNKEVIAVDQDPLGIQGHMLIDSTYNDYQFIWGRPLVDGSFAVVFVNTASKSAEMTCDAACWARTPFKNGTSLVVRDLWKHATIGQATVPNTYTASVGANGASQMYTFSVA